MRHTIIERRDEATPHDFRTIEHAGGEDGLIWTERKGGASTFEANVQELVTRIAGVTGGALQNITITSRSDADKNEPLTKCSYSQLLDTQPGVSLTILLPIRIEPGSESSPLELWTIISRQIHSLSRNPLLYCSGVRYVQRLLGDQILTQFNAGETRPEGVPELFKSFASQTSNRWEVWVRPGWEAVALLPEKFQQPAPRPPVMTEQQIADKANRDLMKRRKALVRSQMASKGLVYSKTRQSWGPAKG